MMASEVRSACSRGDCDRAASKMLLKSCLSVEALGTWVCPLYAHRPGCTLCVSCTFLDVCDTSKLKIHHIDFNRGSQVDCGFGLASELQERRDFVVFPAASQHLDTQELLVTAR